MTTKEILNNIKFSGYNNTMDKTSHEITLNMLFKLLYPAFKPKIDYLRSLQTEQEQSSYKSRNLPAFTISCIAGTDRQVCSIKTYNPLCVIDIDAHDNERLQNAEALEILGWQLYNLPYVVAVSRSCRGNGLFVICYCDDINIPEHYMSISEEIESKLFIKIDKQCKNINRLRFISYDDNIISGKWIKPDDDIIKPHIVKHLLKDGIPVNSSDNCKTSNAEINLAGTLASETFFIKTMCSIFDNGYRLDDYESWYKDGFKLAALGNTGRFFFHKLSEASSGYTNEWRTQKKFEELQRNTKCSKDAAKLYYFGVAKRMFGEDWKTKVESFDLEALCG